MTFEKRLIYFEVVKLLQINEEAQLSVIAYAHTSAVLVISYCYTVQNKQSHRHSLCSVMSHVVLFAYSIKLNISTRSRVTKVLQKKLYCEFKLSLQCNQENT